MKLFIMTLLFTACQATPMDLSGKMFVFPVESATARVQLLPTGSNFASVTVCLRYITDLTRNYGLFSMASRSSHNDFLIFKTSAAGRFDVYTRGQTATFDGISSEQNTWYSICSTWDGNSRLVQLWSNGSPSTKKAGFQGTLDREPFIVLGQEQDSVGGNFDAGQSFVGMITDVHMCNYVLSPCEIQAFTNDLNFTPGNVINWRALEFISTGTVVLDNNQLTGCYRGQS
ncbi:mucosal pentraxin-like [Engraulis encrasicolus]|uniref:mucosal pentraxin-like n=1 Tax=Engraulis encrasicolus TaxID=184585 RepID=UPI002FD1C148